MVNKNNNWFENWFGTYYYQLLYCKRDTNEAQLFVNRIISKLNLSAGSRVWDLACGKGRHSILMAECGMKVSGTDLSEECIIEARKYENENLEFFKLDMREPFRINYFVAVFNLFTSFGYFNNPEDDHKVYKSVHNALKPGGYFILDYFNAKVVMDNLEHFEQKIINDIRFEVKKNISNNRIRKEIIVTDKNTTYKYEESVAIYFVDDFKVMAKKFGFEICNLYGNYSLDKFDENSSPRLIIEMRKVL